MSLAEELLSTLSETVPEHTHPVPDTDTYFIIDPITREIENTNRKKTVVMQYDHNSERFTFQLPRYIDGHDMLQCTSIVVNVDNIEAETGNTNSDAPSMTDLRTNPDDPETVISSWLISRNSTQLAGNLSFHIEYKCVDSEGNVVYEWGTDKYDKIEVRARKKNGEAAVIEYNDTLEQWRTQIFGAGDSVMANIAAEGEMRLAAVTAEGESQVSAVKSESETQQEAIELKGTNTLETIPEDYTETNNLAEEAARTKADAIVGEVEGESIVLNNASDDYLRGLKIYGKSTQFSTTGKNLLDVEEELTFTYIENILLSIPAGTYIVSWASETHDGEYNPYIRFYDNDTGILLAPSNNGKTIVLTNEETRVCIYSNNYSATGSTDISATIKQLMVSVDGGEYEPYTGGKPSPNPDYPQEIESVENPVVNVIGKNLIPYPYHETSATKSGITFTVNSDGTITLNGTIKEATSFIIQYYTTERLYLHGGQAYTFKALTTIGQLGVLHAYISCNGKYLYDIGHGVTFTPAESGYATVCVVVGASAGTLNNLIIKPQLELGETATEYEPYKAQQPLTLTQTLPGIPVVSGGNYTDPDGQQWICDEVDFERGVYVQRIANAGFDGAIGDRVERNDNTYRFEFLGRMNPSFPPAKLINDVYPSMCTALNSAFNPLAYNDVDNAITPYTLGGVYVRCDAYETVDDFVAWATSIDLRFIYALATPIETPLTAEEIAAFKSLHTNRPNTTLLNDAGAYMSAKYNIDTLIFLRDNQPIPTDEQVTVAVAAYLDEHPVTPGASAEEAAQIEANAKAIEGLKKLEGTVKSVNGVKPDTNGNVTVDIPEGFSGSWNDLTDKPFDELSGQSIFDDDIALVLDGSTGIYDFPSTITVEPDSEYEVTYGNVITVTCVSDSNGVISFTNVNGVFTITSERISVMYPVLKSGRLTIVRNNTVIPIDEKYIPDTIARLTDIPDIPEGFSGSWNDLTDKPFNVEYDTQRTEVNALIFEGDTLSGNQMIQDTSSMTTSGIYESTYAIFKYESPTVGLYSVELVGNGRGEFTSNESDVTMLYQAVSWDSQLTVSGLPDELMGESNNVITITFYTSEDVELVKCIDEKFIPDTIARSASSHGLSVADAVGDTPTAAEFNALLAALRSAGYLAN